MRGFVLAAGLGTRLRPLTDVLPKPLVPVAGVPLLQRAIGQLAAAGVRQVGVNTFHLGEQVAQFVQDGAHLGVRATVFAEAPAILGTGGGLKNAEAYLRDGGDAFLLANGDVWHDFDLRALVAAHRPDALATLAVCRAPRRPELHQVFIRGAGGNRGEVAHIRGAPAQAPSDGAVIYSGVGVYSTRLLELLPGGGVEACLVRQGLVPGLAQGMRVDTVELPGAWFDCGTRAEVLRASAYALRGRAAAQAARA
ncbi:MAG: nucleotidyltransferase family protein [Deltaproteobacteria bacterium]|nr:nucleotidyltransferase family protein [Deltaproteobacteria bacterium]